MNRFCDSNTKRKIAEKAFCDSAAIRKIAEKALCESTAHRKMPFGQICDSILNRKNHPLHFAMSFRIAKFSHHGFAVHSTTARCVCRHSAMRFRFPKCLSHIFRCPTEAQYVSIGTGPFVFESPTVATATCFITTQRIYCHFAVSLRSAIVSITFCDWFPNRKIYPYRILRFNIESQI
jgi:hypothetical protein